MIMGYTNETCDTRCYAMQDYERSEEENENFGIDHLMAAEKAEMEAAAAAAAALKKESVEQKELQLA
jgi:hypothetical protein